MLDCLFNQLCRSLPFSSFRALIISRISYLAFLFLVFIICISRIFVSGTPLYHPLNMVSSHTHISQRIFIKFIPYITTKKTLDKFEIQRESYAPLFVKIVFPNLVSLLTPRFLNGFWSNLLYVTIIKTLAKLKNQRKWIFFVRVIPLFRQNLPFKPCRGSHTNISQQMLIKFIHYTVYFYYEDLEQILNSARTNYFCESYTPLFLAHLDLRFRWAIAITMRPSSSSLTF